MWKELRKSIAKDWKIWLLMLSVISLIYSCLLIYGERKASQNTGGSFGTLVGRALGSYQGLVEGKKHGFEDGMEAGLSAEDIEVKIGTDFSKISTLEVLITSVRIVDMHQVGDDIKYAALYSIKGNVVFTVDLRQTDVMIVDDELLITVPKPTGNLKFLQSQIDLIDVYQKGHNTGSAEIGFDAYLNSIKKLDQPAEDVIDNYDNLRELAEQAAKDQITQLVRRASICENKNIIVEFKDWQEDE